MKAALIKLATGLPPARMFPAVFPGLALEPGDLAAIRGCQMMRSLVRVCQLAGPLYAVVYTVEHGGVSGLIAGAVISWVIGQGMPKLPVSVSDKISAYLAARGGLD